jgi:hypothetical protein
MARRRSRESVTGARSYRPAATPLRLRDVQGLQCGGVDLARYR